MKGNKGILRQFEYPVSPDIIALLSLNVTPAHILFLTGFLLCTEISHSRREYPSVSFSAFFPVTADGLPGISGTDRVFVLP